MTVSLGIDTFCSQPSPFSNVLLDFPPPLSRPPPARILDTQVAGSAGNVETGLKQHLERLDEIFAARPDYLQTLRFVQLMVNNVIRELTALPDISKANVDVAAIADQTASVEYYRSGQLRDFM